MSERKVINKYIAPDFDHTLLPARKRPGQIKVRVMLPCSVQCNFCGDYVYKGKKFNARSEICKEDYLGIKMFRFYIKCTTCSSEIVFRTDPQNSDYVVEGGATRNFEPWKQEQEKTQAGKDAKDFEEKGDAMKALENRTLASKREMDIIDALEEIRELNARAAHLDTDETIEKLRESRSEKEQTTKVQKNTNEDDEREIALLFGSKRVEKRLADEDSDEDKGALKKQKINRASESSDPISSLSLPVLNPPTSSSLSSPVLNPPTSTKPVAAPLAGLILKKKRKLKNSIFRYCTGAIALKLSL